MEAIYYGLFAIGIAVAAFQAGRNSKEYLTEDEMIRMIVLRRVEKRIHAEVETELNAEISRQVSRS